MVLVTATVREVRIARFTVDVPEGYTEEDVEKAIIAEQTGEDGVPFEEFVEDDWTEIQDIQEA